MHGDHSTRYVRKVKKFGFKGGVKLPCASGRFSEVSLSVKTLRTRNVTV